MPTAKQLYAKELNAIAKRYGALEDDTIRDMVDLLRELRIHITAEIGTLTDWSIFRLQQTTANIDRMIGQFEQQLNTRLSGSFTGAYQNGAASAIDPFRAAGISNMFFQPTTSQLNVIVNYSARLVRQITEQMRAKIDTQLRLAVLGGKSPLDAMKAINVQFGLSERGTGRQIVGGVGYNAERVVRTEMGRAYNLATYSQAEEAASRIEGLTKSWVATADARTRTSHLEAHRRYADNPIDATEPFIVGGEELRYPGDPNGSPEMTINCILPGNEIIVPDREGMSRVQYDGPAVSILIDGGHELTVTPNHPILTLTGFIAAKFLGEGDYVIRRSRPERIVKAIDDNEDNMPAMIEQVWSSLTIAAQSRRELVSIMAYDLHGDACFTNGDVDVIGAKSQLVSEIEQATFAEQLKQDQLGGCGILECPLACKGAFAEFCHRSLVTTNGIVSSACEFRSLFCGESLHSDSIRFTDAPSLYAMRHKMAGKPIAGYAGLARQALLCLAGLITADQIVKVREFDFRGHVFDLQSMTGLYTSNSILVKNCRCRMITQHPAIGRVGTSLDSRIEREIARREEPVAEAE